MAGERNKLLKSIHRAWDEVEAFLASLTDEQKTEPKDAGGWSVKDHLMHMAVWEDGIDAALNKQDREARMGIDHVTPKLKGVDAINDIIFKQHKDKSLAEVMETRRAVHDRLLKTLNALTDEDILLPYSYYVASSGNNQPMLGHILGNMSGHYRKHLTWMKAIVDRE